MSEKKDYVGYEYRDVTVKEKLVSVYVDNYQNFGWQLEGITDSMPGIAEVTLKLKRDRKVVNKAELTRLQRQFESCMNEILTLENSKVVGAEITAYTTGVLGTAFMAGSVFAYLGGILPLSIVLAIPGFMGWILPYFLFCNVRKKKTEAVEPFINQKYDEIYQVCEKGCALL
jgi:hypothetical protein